MKPDLRIRVALWAESPGLEGVEETLTRLGARVGMADSLEQLVDWIESRSVDLIVTWLCGDDRGAFELLSRLENFSAAPPVLVVSCGLDVNLYLEAMRRGAFDCLALPQDENELVRIVAAATEASPLRVSA